MIKITYKLAMAAGRDAGNRNMRKNGRTTWNLADRNIAAKEFHKLMPKKRGER